MMWVNGVLLGSGQQTSALTTTGPVTLGADKHGTGGFLNGRMDEVRVLSGRTPAISEPPTGDSFVLDADTLVLMHMDGTAGSTNFVDDAGHAVSAVNDVRMETSSRLGTGAGVFDGNGDLLAINAAPELALGAGDFTAEAWVNFDETPSSSQHLFGPHEYGQYTDWCVIAKGSTQELEILLNGIPRLLVPWRPTAGTWTHVAVSRHNGMLMAFLDGELRGATSAPMALALTNPISLGATINSVLPFKGSMDEFRVSRVARYTSDFIPPTRPYRLGE